MDRAVPYALSAVLLCGIGVAVVECGDSGAVCGNSMVEKGEQCDNGAANGTTGNNCSSSCQLQGVQRAQLSVKYERLRVTTVDYPSFPAPTCADLGIAKAHLVLEGPAPQDLTMECGTDFAFSPIDPGSYQATVTLLDANDQPVTKPVKSMMVTTDVGQSPVIDIIFDVPDYLKTYKGNFDFALWWGTKNTACPVGVNKQTMTMTRPGSTTPIAMMTMSGESLDGTQANCFTASSSMPDRVAMMDWGHYDLTVTGKVGSMINYCRKFDIFVGVGIATPTYDLVVDALSTDGGTPCP
jgi:hypothetical protein